MPILIHSAKEKKTVAISGQGFIGEKATVEWFWGSTSAATT